MFYNSFLFPLARIAQYKKLILITYVLNMGIRAYFNNNNNE